MKKEEILKFYKTYKLYVFPLVVAFSSLILIIFVIYPQAVKLITDQRVGVETVSKSQLLEAKAQELEEYDPQDLDEKVSYALSAYPTDKDFVSAMGILQSLIVNSGFNVLSMTLGSASTTTDTQSYSLKVDIIGLQTLLPILLSNIENSTRLMRVNTLQVTTGGGSQGTAASLSIDVLYAAAPTGFGSVDSPLPQLSEKDQEIITKLARTTTPVTQTPVISGHRGKANPFE